MPKAAAAVLVLAALAACAPHYSNGSFRGGDAGPPIAGGSSDGGDGGIDAGDAGDAGPDAGIDAGCGPLTLAGVPAVDNCVGFGVSTTATGTADTGNCTIQINIPTATGPCFGILTRGTANAFTGGCRGGAYTCTSPSLPGRLTCTSGGIACSLNICDAGTSCPP